MIEVLAENARALMDARKLKQAGVAKKASAKGRPIDQRTVGRILAAEFPAQISTIEALAAGIDVEAWQLLIPGLDPKALPRPAPAMADLSRAELDEVEQRLADFKKMSPAQRDMFIQDSLVSDLLSRDHFPIEKMTGNWTGPHAVQQPRGKYDKDRK